MGTGARPSGFVDVNGALVEQNRPSVEKRCHLASEPLGIQLRPDPTEVVVVVVQRFVPLHRLFGIGVPRPLLHGVRLGVFGLAC